MNNHGTCGICGETVDCLAVIFMTGASLNTIDAIRQESHLRVAYCPACVHNSIFNETFNPPDDDGCRDDEWVCLSCLVNEWASGDFPRAQARSRWSNLWDPYHRWTPFVPTTNLNYRSARNAGWLAHTVEFLLINDPLSGSLEEWWPGMIDTEALLVGGPPRAGGGGGNTRRCLCNRCNGRY